MTLQTDPRFKNTTIPRYGCYFMTLVRIAEIETNYELFPGDIYAIYTRALAENYIDQNCYVMAPDAVLRLAIALISSVEHITDSHKVLQVGIEDKDGKRFWGWVKGNSVDYYVAKLKTKYGYHFVLNDKNGNTIYNSDPRYTGEKVSTIFYRRF